MILFLLGGNVTEEEFDAGLQEITESAEFDVLAILGYLAHELSAHTTEEGLAANCARSTGINEEFVRELLKDCTGEFFKRLVQKKH